MRYIINTEEAFRVREKLNLENDASPDDVLSKIDKLQNELELLARAVCLHERGNPEYIDQKIWEFDIMEKIAKEFE